MPFKSLSFTLLLVISSSSVFAAERVALVIGNNDYEHIGVLKNPIADATAVAEHLTKLGFKLIRPIRENSDVQSNLTLAEMQKARFALVKAANHAEIAFLYYAGHGASLGKKKEAHIIPINVPEPTLYDENLQYFQSQSLSLDSFLKDITKKAELTVAVFDACREIPELYQLAKKVDKDRGLFDKFHPVVSPWRGLGRIKERNNQIVAYSGSQGEVVPDGTQSAHSPYTAILLSELDKNPYQEVGDLFREVAYNVSIATGQLAEISIKAKPNHYFFKKSKSATQPPDHVKPTKTEINTYRLMVNVIPKTAKIRILNKALAYRKGMMLTTGKYHIEVSNKNYKTHKQWIELGRADKSIKISLKKKSGRRIGQYIDHDNGTISDTKTKLMWKKCSEGQRGNHCAGTAKTYTWKGAVDRFRRVSFAGHNDWRIPTIKELRTLIYCSNGTPQYQALDKGCNKDYNRTSDGKAAIHNNVFPNTGNWLYWSSSSYAYGVGDAWIVDFNYGNTGSYHKNGINHVRLVRSGQ